MENNFKKWKNRDVLNARDYVFERDTIVDEINIAQKNQFYPNTKNKSGVTIPKGAVVQFEDSQGDFILIKNAVASEINADNSLLMGLAREDIADDAFGDVVWFGNVLNVATGNYTLGQILWYDPSTGGLTATEPDTNKIQIAAVEKTSSNPQSQNGILLVRIKFVSRSIDDINEIQVDGAATGSVLRKAANGNWVASDLSDFATDAELTAGLATKEDAFNKNTAFNKNFGTTAGTVAEGDHTHDDRYYTETELNDGQLDTRYYTETEVDNTFIPLTQKGANNGVAELNESGKVPASQLPSYVDDILEAYVRDGATLLASDWLSLTGTTGAALTPEAGKIYMVIGATDTNYINTTYRWGGSVYAVIGDIALGETSATAYRGDRGKIAYDFSQTFSGLQNTLDGKVSKSGDTMTGNLTIDSANLYVDGNVGVGTTSPSYKLHVNSATSGIFSRFSSPASRLDIGADGNGAILRTGAINKLQFLNATNQIVAILDDGKLGIGTTTPQGLLSVVGSTAGVEVDNSATNESRILSYDRVANAERQLETRGSLLRYTTNANERMRITSAGNVGIGNTNPQEKLDVTGNIKASGTIVASGEITAPSIVIGSWRIIPDESSATLNFELV